MANALFSSLSDTVDRLMLDFDRIPADRKQVLHQLADLVRNKVRAGQPVNLNFICTHNSRRSHIAQLWAQAVAYYYDIPGVRCFSGGTEATAFNPRAIGAMRDAGFEIARTREGDNPLYEVRFAENAPSIVSFSKTYDDPVNAHEQFAAIMTCSHADENCPLIPGADARLVMDYDDPKHYDGSLDEVAMYQNTVHQIGREILYAFSRV